MSRMNNVRLICFHFVKKGEKNLFLFNVEKIMLNVCCYGLNIFLDIWVFKEEGSVAYGVRLVLSNVI